MICAVYIIRCSANNRIYVGSSLHVLRRWNDHKRKLERGVHRSRHLQRAFRKHGMEAFSMEILEHCTPETVLGREQHYLDTLRPFGRRGFNWSKNSRVPSGHPVSASTRRKIAKAATGRRHTEETKEKIRKSKLGSLNPFWGKKHTEENKKKMNFRGQNSPLWGRKASVETRRKQGIAKGTPVAMLGSDGAIKYRFYSAAEAARRLGLKNGCSIVRACKLGARCRDRYWQYDIKPEEGLRRL